MVSRRTFSCAILLAILLTGVVVASVSYFVWAGGIGAKPSPNIALDDFPKCVSFQISNDGLGNFWAGYQNGSVLYWGTNGSDITLAALNYSSSSGGGCVYVYPATSGFSGTIALPNATRLVIELGVQGLSYTVASGATCIIADYNGGAIKQYNSGTLTYNENMTAGVISSLSWLNSTQASFASGKVIIDGSGNAWATGVNATWLNSTGLMLYNSNPNTSTWGSAQTGIFWYDSVDDQMEYWNGTATVLVPSIGGGSVNGTYELAPSYTVYASGSTYYAMAHNAAITSNSSYSYLINNLISKLTSGGEIFTVGGIYPVTSAITVNQNNGKIVLDGEGSDTILRLGYSGDLIDISGTGAWYDTVENMQLDGNKANYPSGGVGVNVGITPGGSDDAHTRLLYLEINNTHTGGVDLVTGRAAEVDHVTVTTSDGYGFKDESAASDAEFANDVAGNCGGIGYYLESGNSYVVNSEAFGSGLNGHYADSFHSSGFVLTGQRNRLVSNQAQDCWGNGFDIYNSPNNVLDGNTADTNGKNSTFDSAGFLFDQSGSNNETCTGSIALNRAGQGNPQDYGFWITSSPTAIVLEGDIANYNALAGILVQSSNDFVHACLNETTWVT